MRVAAGTAAVALLASAPTLAQVVYVDADATGANDGSSWTDAYTDLQSALPGGLGSEVWIAEGTYTPSASDRSVSFVPYVPLYGGFVGTETDRDHRLGSAEKTILSGDLLGDDGPGFTNRADNSYHVVLLDTFSFADLDRLTIRGGHADGPGDLGAGGGLLSAYEVSVDVTNCVFEDNDAGYGGAAFLRGLREVVGCVFRDNRATAWGGAVHAEPIFFPPAFDGCTFVRNVAEGVGGGALYGYSESAVVDSLFVGNRADGTSEGGGAAHYRASFVNCTVVGNTAFASAAGCGGIADADAVENTILWQNADDGGMDESAQLQVDPGVASHSLVQGWEGSFGGSGNFDGPPRFADPLGPDGVPASGDEDWSLAAGSPALDRGTVSSTVAMDVTDLFGRPRIVNALACDEAPTLPGEGLVDLGALETQAFQLTSNFCASAGTDALLSAPCGVPVSRGTFDVEARPVTGRFGYFVAGATDERALFRGTVLCVGGPHLFLGGAGAHAGALSLTVDLGRPSLAAALVPGTTWFVQAVFRQLSPGGVGTSDAASIVFRP